MIVIGRKDIEKHLNLSWPTIKKLYRLQGLPLVMVGGQWALHTDKVSEWWDRQYRRQRRAING